MVLMVRSDHQPFHQVILANALVQPEAPCVTDDTSQLNYREFAHRVGQWSAWLARNNLAKGHRVGLLMTNTADHLAVILAMSASGVVHLSLTLADSLEFNQRLVESLGISSIISDAVEEFPGCVVLNVRKNPPARDDSGFMPLGICGPDDPWKIVLSSGSTGHPKMILQTQAMELGYHFRRPERPAHNGLRFLQTVELRYTYGLRVCLSVLMVGGEVVLTGPDASIGNLASLLIKHRITRLATTPFHALGLAKWFASQASKPAHLDQVATSGSIATRFMQEEVHRYLCANIVVHYGTNEVGGIAVADAALLAKHPDSVGVPAPGVEINIVRPDGTLADPDETGLLRARGLNFPKEYIDNPQESAKAFRDGWFFPGDLASRGRDGEIYFRGRADDLMNFNGIKIAPTDIEMALQSHPDVRQAIAFVIDHPLHQDYPCVAVTVAKAASQQDLLKYAHAKLGRRAPKLVMVLPEMPTMGVGKPDRKAVRQIALSLLAKQHP
jgi:acyl-coenzyme A synthetase/AMP-(fatty) acid ligase